PGGALGTRVMRVREVMRTGDANPIVREDEPLARAVAVMTQTPGRPGATNVVDKRGRLVGIFTDGDLRRLFERSEADPNRPVGAAAPPARAVGVTARPPGRPGATNVVDRRGRLVGIFTDGDLRRLFERSEAEPNPPAGEVMGRDPTTVEDGMLVIEAARVLRD